MAYSWLSTLAPSVRLAYPIIKSGVKAGLTTRSLQSLLTKSGLGIRRQTLLDVMRLEKKGFASAKTFRILDPNVLPRRGDFPMSIHRVSQRFNYVFDVQLEVQGKVERRNMVVASESVMTLNQATAIVEANVTARPEVYGEGADVLSVEPTEIFQAGRKGYIQPMR